MSAAFQVEETAGDSLDVVMVGSNTLTRYSIRRSNDSGLAVTVYASSRKGRSCLLPGDAAYQCSPSVAATGERFNALCMSHHGGCLHSNDYPSPKRGAVAVNSSGPGNTYSHPLFKTLAAHLGQGWPMPAQTGISGSRPCHVFLPWGKKPQIFQHHHSMESDAVSNAAAVLVTA